MFTPLVLDLVAMKQAAQHVLEFRCSAYSSSSAFPSYITVWGEIFANVTFCVPSFISGVHHLG